MKKLLILSGAGLSAESGISTFRDKNGLWENHRIEDVCDIRTWCANYDLVHQFYNERRIGLASVEPNAAHRKIAEWEATYPTMLLTQNIDDLLERGGCREVIHLHGFLPEMECTTCGDVWSIGYRSWADSDKCARCNNRASVKPRVVFFGENAPEYARLYQSLQSLRRGDVFLVVGTTGTVLPVNAMAYHLQCTKILNNLEPSEAIEAGNFDHVFYEPATQAVTKIDALLKEILG